MKFMILVKSNPDLEASLAAMSDSQMKEQMAAMGVFNEELKKAGVMKACDGLRPSREGKRVHFDGNTRTVVDGPFTGDLAVHETPLRSGPTAPHAPLTRRRHAQATARPVRGLRASTGTKTRPTHDRARSLTRNSTRA